MKILQATASQENNRISFSRVSVISLAGLILLALVFSISLSYGAFKIPLPAVLTALFDLTPKKETLIIQNLRLPRAIVTALIGANLAVAGALMQAITRNPMASPSIFGINAGASFFVVLAVFIFPAMPASMKVFGAFGGALATALIVYFVSHMIRWGKLEIKMALTGVTFQAFLAVGTQALLLFNESKTESVLFWLAGSVIGRNWDDVAILVPWSAAALLIGIGLGRAVSVLSLGDEVARGLGQKVGLLRATTLAAVVVLAGVSVAIAGPIGFIGLMVPHIARYLVGIDYRAVLPVSAILGAVLLVAADVLSRTISFPGETPVGVVTALLGAPFFIYLARRKGSFK